MKKFEILSVLILAVVLMSAGFGNKPKDKVKLSKSFTSKYAFIPSGLVSMEDSTSEVGAFFMLKTEVSNAQYIEFLNSLEDEQSKETHAIKSERWTKVLNYDDALAAYYHTKEAYQNYPVVNITAEDAAAYCEWLTEKYQNEDIGLPEDMKIVFRLPSRAEWVRAANGEKPAPYSWGTKYIRDTDGIYLANFNALGSEHIRKNEATGEYEVVQPEPSKTEGNEQIDHKILTAPVDSYASNSFGLKQMNGNVAEILANNNHAAGGSWRSPGYDIRNESLMKFNEASPEVGFRPIGILTTK